MATNALDDMALTPYEQPRNNIIVRPLVRPADMLAAIQEYEALKTAILLPKDVQVIGDKTHIKKSGWLRIARAFGLTVEPVSCTYVPDPTGGDDWGYEVVARAIAPNGASMSGDGACWATEKVVKPRGWKGAAPTDRDIAKAAEKTRDMQTRHNVRAHAFTRATNRAISNLVGGGEVSAEELGDYVDEDPSPRQQHPVPIPAANDTRKVVTPQISRDRARLQATPTATTVDDLVNIATPPPASPAAPAAKGKHNPSRLKERARAVGIEGEDWGTLWSQYSRNLDGLDLYLTAKEASMQSAKVDDTTEFEYALEGLPVSGMN